jgi:hypothetical protein
MAMSIKLYGKYYLKMRNKNIFFTLLLFCFCVAFLPAQEALLSNTEHYYDFLALQGLTERPYLNYRTLSDSVWEIEEGVAHPWQGQNLGTKRSLFGDMSMRIYGPELFSSFNTAVPYGQNDGTLWQGKGFNSSFTAGLRFEGYGFEATLKPQVAFSQNLAFDYIAPNYSSANYAGKGDTYGYYGIPSVDAPQRFGNEPFFAYDWGDSEIRYAWKTLTVGFGTQTVWLGPARLNPIIHSNNAPSYPKLDIGLRKQRIVIPRLNWYLGDIETRLWWGYLSESDYFDNDSNNDHNLITGFALAYAPSFLLKGFTIGFNRIMLSKWNDMDYASVFTLLMPFMVSSAGEDERDQRASVVFSYIFPNIGAEIYFEWARNDFTAVFDHLIQYPFHSQAYSFGVRKNFLFSLDLQGELLLEITNLESSRDFELEWPTTFYAHHKIIQGHTNRGQWLGAGTGTGGNSQYLGFALIHSKGYVNLFVQRKSIDNDYIWFMHIGEPIAIKKLDEWKMKALFSLGINSSIFINNNLCLFSDIIISHIYKPTYKEDETSIQNWYFSAGVKITI